MQVDASRTGAEQRCLQEAGVDSLIETARLKLIPATLGHVRAEIEDPVRFAKLLNAKIPANWPPESARDALPLFLSWMEAAPDQTGWFGWYALLLASNGGSPTLVGGGGFLGPPAAGEVQIGYSMLPQFQRRGIATEMVTGLVEWALQQGEVSCIIAETEWENPPSVQVLKKIGFNALGATNTAGGMRFELRRSSG
jgi:[ribosomal protein S5]-alanine N-acetyltransferase